MGPFSKHIRYNGAIADVYMRKHKCRETDITFTTVYGAEVATKKTGFLFLIVIYCSILFQKSNWTLSKSCNSAKISHVHH